MEICRGFQSLVDELSVAKISEVKGNTIFEETYVSCKVCFEHIEFEKS